MLRESTESLEATGSTIHARLGQDARIELQCDRCGYGAVVTSPPRRCPMCGGEGWRLAKRLYSLPTLSE
jgi:rubrerythrin